MKSLLRAGTSDLAAAVPHRVSMRGTFSDLLPTFLNWQETVALTRKGSLRVRTEAFGQVSAALQIIVMHRMREVVR